MASGIDIDKRFSPFVFFVSWREEKKVSRGTPTVQTFHLTGQALRSLRIYCDKLGESKLKVNECVL